MAANACIPTPENGIQPSSVIQRTERFSFFAKKEQAKDILVACPCEKIKQCFLLIQTYHAHSIKTEYNTYCRPGEHQLR